jgi:hypothetical protein
MLSMKKVIKRIPVFLLILILAGLLHYGVSDPEQAFSWLLSGDPRAIGRLFGMGVGFGSIPILINFTIGLIVSLITRNTYSGSVVAIVIGIIWGYAALEANSAAIGNNGILQMVTLGGGATLLILQIGGNLKFRSKKPA